MPASVRIVVQRFKRRLVLRIRRMLSRPTTMVAGTTGPLVRFRCNLCGAQNVASRNTLGREIPSCWLCGSTVRFRAIGHVFAREVFGTQRPLPELPVRRDLHGIGLSDPFIYADELARCSKYENTFFHVEPYLDITDVPPGRLGRYDFIIASDVFEHVAPPVSRAFKNARALLKPGGVLILTVPFAAEGETIEHFPQLFDWRVEQVGNDWCLVNRTADGIEQVFQDIYFHGGPGTTLEMRRFSRNGLEGELADAGFVDVRFEGDDYEPFGIVWQQPVSVPIIARAPSRSD